MLAKARDVMTRKFTALRPQMTVIEAMRLFEVAGTEEGNRIYGMVVLNDAGYPVGMLSMYDILSLLRPQKISNWDSMDDQEVDALMGVICDRIKTTQVEAIMTRDVITITPDTHAYADSLSWKAAAWWGWSTSPASSTTWATGCSPADPGRRIAKYPFRVSDLLPRTRRPSTAPQD
jgi:hypothetical protein